DGLVAAVDAALGHVFAQPVQQVADVVQQRGRHQGVVGAVPLRQVRRLERVLLLRNRLAEILQMAAGREEFGDFLQHVHSYFPRLLSRTMSRPDTTTLTGRPSGSWMRRRIKRTACLAISSAGRA